MAVLKPLSAALAAQDRIYCVIRATAVNNDGFSNGLTSPSPLAQQAALREAYARAAIAPERVDYVEAHGTGTFLGDTIEAKALGAVLGAGRAQGQPLLIGSIKSNIGHLEAASGMAGLLKAALAVHHRAVPPSLHCEQLNPHVPFDALHVKVQRSLSPWPRRDGGASPVAGVNSFGFGGTNCHVVLEGVRRRAELFVLSAESAGALTAAARERLDRWRDPAARPPLELACAEVAGREDRPHRLALTVHSMDELTAHLEDLLGGRSRPGQSRGVAGEGRKLAFVYSGHGGQWPGMGRELLQSEPAFRAAIERCDDAIRRQAGFSVLAELHADREASRLSRIDVAQPTLFALQVALGELWRAWGVTPDAVVGHSMGEVAAAHSAGILDLDDAVKVVLHRSRLVARLMGKGDTAVVELGFEEAGRLVEGHGNRLCVAVRSSPTSTVIAGDPDALDELITALKARGTPCGRVNTSGVAAHSPQMDPLCEELFEALRGIRPREGSVPVVSTVTAAPLEGRRWDAAYWARNLREMVLFGPAIERLAERGHSLFLEIGPHPILAHHIQGTVNREGREATVLGSLVRAEDARAAMLSALGALYTTGRAARSGRLHTGLAERPAPAHVEAWSGGAAADPELLVASAHTPEALRELARAMSSLLTRGGAPALRDVGYTAGARRAHHAHRLSLVARSGRDAVQALEAFLRGEAHPGLSVEAPGGKRPKVALLFSGERAMEGHAARRLGEQDATFQCALRRCERALGRAAGDPSPFSVQVALAAVFQAWGVTPAAIVGQGPGRVAAAHVAGALSLEDAARLLGPEGQATPEVIQALEALVAAAPTGEALEGSAGGAERLLRAVAEPEQLALAAQGLLDEGVDLLVAIGAGAALEEALQAIGRSAALLPSRREGEEDRAVLLASLGALYTRGYPVDWRGVYPGGGRVVELPSYPWQRERHWLRSPAAAEQDRAERAPEQIRHTLLPRLTGALPRERREVIAAYIAAQVRAVLGLAPEAPLDAGLPLKEMGLDSALATQLRLRLGDAVERALPATLVYNHPTVDARAASLDAELSAAPPERAASGPGRGRRKAGLDAAQGAGAAPIAVIGVGCRFPGAAGPDAFWRLLRDGVDAIGEVPPSRWDIDAFYDPELSAPGKMNTRWGGFLDDIESFDARFFGLSQAEASRMDPQQRLILEVAWEALEHAGVAPASIAASEVGVFVGISALDFPQMLQGVPTRAGTGMIHSIAANRLSYLLDLRGPSVAVDTACSSSLVAVHLACQSLRSGDADMAFAAGVNVILSPAWTASFSQAGMMAANGRCKSFDAAADGYVRGEGCGVVVLKRLDDALRDGDTVLALLRGSAVNQDGRSNGLTAPNGLAQQAVIQRALASAGVEPREIGYVEAHGSGTPLGDAIEVHSLAAVLAEGRAAGSRCLLGSVKTNIGHLESAAGIAGLIKCVLALHHREIPPHLHLQTVNPSIALEQTPLAIPRSLSPWPEGYERRRVGASSFGIGGTNAHVVIEEAPPAPPDPTGGAPRCLLTLSAGSEPALRALAGRYATHITDRPGGSLASLCYTANTGRAELPHRLALRAGSAEQVGRDLAAFAAGERPEGLLRGPERPIAKPRIAFLFTGQGAQYAGMGRRLHELEPVFRATLDECADVLRPLLDRPLLDVLFSSSDRGGLLDETAYAQPALFAIELAMAALWRSWGITPDAVMGHSVGEYAAACVAVVLGVEDGLRLVAERGRLMAALPRVGAMSAVFASEAEVAAAIGDLGAQVSIAAVNGPKNTVISGYREPVEAVLARLEDDFVVTRPMRTSHAFHSALMDEILEPFAAAAGKIRYSPPSLPLIQNLTGRRCDGGQAPGAAYFQRHLREPVRFAAGIEALAAEGCDTFLEVGPHDTLVEMGRRCLPGGRHRWVASLRREEDDVDVIVGAAGALFVGGAALDWRGFWGGSRPRRAMLPTYPFERRRCWPEPAELMAPQEREEQIQ